MSMIMAHNGPMPEGALGKHVHSDVEGRRWRWRLGLRRWREGCGRGGKGCGRGGRGAGEEEGKGGARGAMGRGLEVEGEE